MGSFHTSNADTKDCEGCVTASIVALVTVSFVIAWAATPDGMLYVLVHDRLPDGMMTASEKASRIISIDIFGGVAFNPKLRGENNGL